MKYSASQYDNIGCGIESDAKWTNVNPLYSDLVTLNRLIGEGVFSDSFSSYWILVVVVTVL